MSSSSSSDEGAPPAVSKARASSPDSDSKVATAASLKPWLEKLLDAFQDIPAADPEKGPSVMKVRQYLQAKYQVSKAQMKEIWAPTMKTALARKLIVKTTAPRMATVGSARLNPAIAISRLQRNEEEVLDKLVAVAAKDEKIDRKRRATSDDDALKAGSAKRRLPFGKN